MSTTVKGSLSYEERYGRDIRDVVARLQDRLQKAKLSPKYQKWFAGGGGMTDKEKAEEGRKFAALEAQAVGELAEKTKRNLSSLGNDSYDAFEANMARMVPGHKMAKSIKATILSPDRAHFGACRIGRLTLEKRVEGNTEIVTEMQVYTTNFDTQITTDRGSNMYDPKDNKFGRTFFAVAIDIDTSTGLAKGFNKKFGKEGVLFQTSELEDALFYLAAKASGKSLDEVVAIYQRMVREETARKASIVDKMAQQRAAARAMGMRR
jgi:hypothetical protein